MTTLCWTSASTQRYKSVLIWDGNRGTHICLDDDASTCALLKWSSNKNWMINNKTNVCPTVAISKGKNKGQQQKGLDKGKLPKDILEPSFLAVPNHLRKVWTGERRSRVEVYVSVTHGGSTLVPCRSTSLYIF
jgi:hypothetical protein